jgi:hypothetical protein
MGLITEINIKRNAKSVEQKIYIYLSFFKLTLKIHHYIIHTNKKIHNKLSVFQYALQSSVVGFQ